MSTEHHRYIATGDNQMEAQNIFSQYLDLYSYDCNLFKFYFATNGALDWFGRTIRGNGKIHEFLRMDVCSRYEHLHFSEAQYCDPVEYKPSHFKTREVLKETIVPTETEKLFKKPSLKFYAESDGENDKDKKIDEEEDFGVALSQSFSKKTTESDLNDDRLKNVITPPPNIDLPDYGPTAPKRPKICLRTETTIGVIPLSGETEKDIDKSHSSSLSSRVPSTNSITANDNGNEYSILKYIVARGTIRSILLPKHRGVGGSRISLITSLNQDGEFFDRETQIKISYRTRSSDNQVQFALVIYENLTQSSRVSRRNLMDEFTKVADVDDLPNVSNDDSSTDVQLFKTPPTTPSRTTKRDKDLVSPKKSPNSKHTTARSLRFF